MRPNFPIRIQLGLKGWPAIAAAVTILVIVAVAVAFLALSLLVFALPVLIIAPILYWFLPKRQSKPIIYPSSKENAKHGVNEQIIDGEFRVMDAEAIEK